MCYFLLFYMGMHICYAAFDIYTKYVIAAHRHEKKQILSWAMPI